MIKERVMDNMTFVILCAIALVGGLMVGRMRKK